VFAEFERAIVRERVLYGLARVKAEAITLGAIVARRKRFRQGSGD
jgi:hypothetical protein